MRLFFAGIGFGVVAGLLLAPKRGNLIRADIRKRAGGILQSATGVITNRRRQAAKKSVQSAPPAEKTDSAAEILNTASREALIAVHGIGEVLADRIIEKRPYQSAYDVVEKRILPENTFLQLRRELLEKGA